MQQKSWELLGYSVACGYPVLHFHFAYNSCVEFRTRGLCKRSGWWDVMRAARLACRGTCGDYELNLRFL